jgi:hypothetical protein
MEANSCSACKRALQPEQTVTTCYGGHPIHFLCYNRFREASIYDFVECPAGDCKEECRQKVEDYFKAFCDSAKLGLPDISKFIVENCLKRDTYPAFFKFCCSYHDAAPAALLLDGGYIQWEEVVESVFEACAATRWRDIAGVLKALVRHGFDPLTASHNGQTLTELAFKAQQSGLMRALVQDHGFCPEERYSIMHLIEDCAHSSVVVYLMECGRFNLNLQDGNGCTVLHYIVLKNNFYLLNMALRNGARMDIQDNNGYNPLDLAYYYRKDNLVNHMRIRGGALSGNAKRRGQ